MALAVSLLSLNFTAVAAENAKIFADDAYFCGGNKNSTEIIKLIDGYNNSEYTQSELKNNLAGQLIGADVYISGAENTDIYGVQFSLSTKSNSAALAYFSTTLQNGNKAGSSLWFAGLKTKDTNHKSAQLLMYGTKSVNTELNKTLNRQKDGSVKIGTLYFAVANDAATDFTIDCTVEDIAAKNKSGEVVSVIDNFKKSFKINVRYSENKKLGVTMLGAQIRTKGRQGLRFGTQIDTDEFYKKCTSVSYGTLIAPTASLKSDKLTLNYKGNMYNAKGVICEKGENYLIFGGAITDFPENGDYDDTNFTAVGYVKYKAPNSDEYTVVYSEPIIRNVNMVKSALG